MRTVIYFVRHAEAEGNIKKIFHGWTDSLITEKGCRQACQMAKKFKNIPLDVIYSSNLKRTIQTAEYIAAIKNMPIVLKEGLREINGGDWECTDWDVLMKKWPKEYNTWENTPHNHKMPNGETMKFFQERLINEVKNIVKYNEGKIICIVTHGMAIRTLLSSFKYSNLSDMNNIKWQENTAISVVNHIAGTFKVISEGQDCHLGDDLNTIKSQDWWEDYLRKFEEDSNQD